MKEICECNQKGILQPRMKNWYSEEELPFVNHEPGECKCTNELKQYIRNGKKVWLCSNCKLISDIAFKAQKCPLKSVEDVKTFIKEDYKNTVLAKRGEISWQEYARRREKLAGEELSK